VRLTLGGEHEIRMPPNRKDTATTFTRKLVFDAVPREISAHHYRGVEEVIITLDCLAWELSSSHLHGHIVAKNARLMREMLTVLSQLRDPSAPLHISIRFGFIFRNHDLNSLFGSHGEYTQGIDATYAFHNVSITGGRSTLLIAYRVRGVVHFDKGDLRMTQDRQDARELISTLDRTMRWYNGDLIPGCLFICGLPQVVLTPEEIEAAGDDVNEDALLKLHETSLRPSWPYHDIDTTQVTWEDFQARIKLVNSSFRPTRADLAAEL